MWLRENDKVVDADNLLTVKSKYHNKSDIEIYLAVILCFYQQKENTTLLDKKAAFIMWILGQIPHCIFYITPALLTSK